MHGVSISNPSGIQAFFGACFLTAALSTAHAGPVNGQNPIRANAQAIAQNTAAIESNKAAIDANESRVTANENAIAGISGGGPLVVRDATGQTVGYLAGLTSNLLTASIMNASGFLMSSVSLNEGRLNHHSVGKVGFESLDCTGTGYVEAERVVRGEVLILPTYQNATYHVYYSPKTAEPVPSVNIQSEERGYSGCVLNTVTATNVMPIYPNDSAITGVPDTPYPAPLSVGLSQ